MIRRAKQQTKKRHSVRRAWPISHYARGVLRYADLRPIESDEWESMLATMGGKRVTLTVAAFGGEP